MIHFHLYDVYGFMGILQQEGEYTTREYHTIHTNPKLVDPTIAWGNWHTS